MNLNLFKRLLGKYREIPLDDPCEPEPIEPEDCVQESFACCMDCSECAYARGSRKFPDKLVCNCTQSPARGRMVAPGEFCSHFEVAVDLL